MSYETVLVERALSDHNGELLSDNIAAELRYLATQGLHGFSIVPIQDAGRTSGVIILAKGDFKSETATS